MRRFLVTLFAVLMTLGAVTPVQAQLINELYANNATSTLAAGIDDDDTSLTVASGHGARFPSPTGSQYFWLTLEEDGTVEVLKCAARTNDVISSCTRAQQNTSASAFTTGANVYLAPTAQTFNNIRALTGLGFVTTASTSELSGETVTGSGVATWLATPSSANLATAVTGETGSGALVFATSPTLVTPTLGAATATSLSFGADPADAGTIRLSNNTGLAWEAATPGTDLTLTLTSSDVFSFSAGIIAPGLSLASSGIADFGAGAVLELPNSSSPTVDDTAEVAFDTDLWRGAIVYHDGTGSAALVGIVTSDTCGDGEVPKFSTSTNTWSCETDSTGSGSLGTNLSSTDKDILTDDSTLVLGGTGGTNNEDLVFDFETNANTIGVSSTTSATLINFASINLQVPTEAYDSTGWNGDNTVPTKDAVRDILETFVSFTDPDADRIMFWDDSAGTAVALTAPNTFAISNTTLSVTIPRSYYYRLAACQNTTASVGVDVFTSGGATATCVTGTNATRAVLDFANSGVSAVQGGFRLPANYSGTISVNLKWRTSATTGDVVWQVATACTADAEVFNDTFNTASTVTDTAKGTTLQLNDAAISTLTTTGCAAGEHLQWRLFRDADHASDNLAATAQLLDIEFRVPEVF